MREEEKYMQTSSSCKQDHIYFNVFSGTTPIYHVAILQKSSAYFCKSEIEKKKSGLNETEQDSMVPALHVLSLPFVYGKPLAKE